MSREIFEKLCTQLVSDLGWRRYEEFVCIDQDVECEDSNTAYSLHHQQDENGEVIILKLYEAGEHLSSVLWTQTKRIWRNEITAQTLIRVCNNELQHIYSELAEKTASITA